LAATAQFRWPPASTFVAAYAQDLMAADTLDISALVDKLFGPPAVEPSTASE
jgi:hypothetical protein